MKVTDVYPRQLPDLFVGRAVVLTGRFSSQGNEAIRIFGKAVQTEQQIDVEADSETATHKGIAAVWARKKIEDLSNQATYDNNNELPAQIKKVALEFGLISNYTAFVAVDSSEKTQGDHGVSIAVPVPVPDGVRYETTVQEK
jgi:Ca-activated chloride channel family protein